MSVYTYVHIPSYMSSYFSRLPSPPPRSQLHRADHSRCEDHLNDTFGMDERGNLRDWNEEIQHLRDLSATTTAERVIKAKVLQKVRGRGRPYLG